MIPDKVDKLSSNASSGQFSLIRPETGGKNQIVYHMQDNFALLSDGAQTHSKYKGLNTYRCITVCS